MATPAIKIDTNVTGLSIALETSALGVLPATPVWVPMEPNSYNDFGGKITTIARNPINAGRKRKKGVVTDLDAAAGFVSDITQTGLSDLFQGLFFASFRRKTESGQGTTAAITSVSATQYVAASGTLVAFKVGDLIKPTGFASSTNNAFNRITVVAAGAISTATGLVVDAAPASGSSVVQVGFQFGSAEVNIDATPGAFPKLVRVGGTKALTDFGLIPGEWVYIGGDSAAMKFVTAANNGFCRVRTVTATEITFDKTAGTMVDETGTGLTIQIFFGRVLRDETGTSIVRRNYQLERTLGNVDLDFPLVVQSEYVKGSIFNTANINVPKADKVTVELGFIATNSEVLTDKKSGTRPALVESDAFNTSSDITRIKLAQFSNTDSNPSALFSYIENLTLSFNNNASPNKAVAVLGAFEVSVGNFEVGGQVNAYFADIAAISAVRNNSDMTLDAHFVKSNAGITIDLPLVTFGDGQVKAEQNTALMIPLELNAADGSKVVSTMNHTALMVYWDYLPSAADS